MEGVVVNFRGSHKTQYTSQMIIKIPEITSKEEAIKLINKKAIWTSPAGKQIIGIIKKEHGNNGALRVRFEKGLPGQAIGKKVKIE